jgi:hypothetical protein
MPERIVRVEVIAGAGLVAGPAELGESVRCKHPNFSVRSL